MDTLVNRYDRAVEDLITRDHKIAKLTDDMLRANREIENLVDSNKEMKKKIDD